MALKSQHVLDRWIGLPLCALLSFIDRLWPRRGRGSPSALLIVLPSEVSHFVYAQPLVRRLRERCPDAVLYMLVPARDRAWLEVLNLVPADHVIAFDPHSLVSALVSGLRALARMRRARIEATIDCEPFARSRAIQAYLSGARLRVGFRGPGAYRGSFINRPVAFNPYLHIGLQFLILAEALESESRPLAKAAALPERPMLAALEPSAEELTAASARLNAAFPALRKRRLVLLHPGAGALGVRAWPLESFAALATWLVDQGYAVGIIGFGADARWGDAIVDQCETLFCADLTRHITTPRELVLLFHRAALLVSNDAGPAHLAALTPLHILALYGPSTPLLCAPLSPRAQCLVQRTACSPCLTASHPRRSPCDGDNQCLKRLSVTEVAAAARRLLEIQSLSALPPYPPLLAPGLAGPMPANPAPASLQTGRSNDRDRKAVTT